MDVADSAHPLLDDVPDLRIEVNGIDDLQVAVSLGDVFDRQADVSKPRAEVFSSVPGYEKEPPFTVAAQRTIKPLRPPDLCAWRGVNPLNRHKQSVHDGVSGHKNRVRTHAFRQKILPGGFRRGEVKV